MLGTAIFFLLFLGSFVAIGLWSATRRQPSAADYLVASRSINPWLTSLSAVATNNSGFMFLGLVADAYANGIRASWLMVGWVLGDWMAWFFVHKRLREQSEERDSRTIPSFLGGDIKNGAVVVAVAGLIVLVFLGIYAGAQLNAGGKALHFVFHWDLSSGAIIGAFIVAAYCFAGGIRASIWTDAAQSIVMLGAMLLLVVVALVNLGGFSALWHALESINPDLTVIAPSDYKFGFAGYVLGWMGAGAGVVGQPHVMVRAMAIDSPDNIAKARRIYFAWYAIFAAACVAVGLAARALLDGTQYGIFPPNAGPFELLRVLHTGGIDNELALPILAGQLLPPTLIGLMLAGIFAATISTADSQILSCSAAVTNDLFPRLGTNYAAIKAATLGVTAFALLMTLYGPDSVFSLVTLAWATLASGLGPLMVIRVFRWRINAPVALLTMVGGVSGALFWRFGLGWQNDMYDVLPGMVAGFVIYAIAISVLRADGSETEEA